MKISLQFQKAMYEHNKQEKKPVKVKSIIDWM